MSKDPYEVAPGLWIGSRYGDLCRERKILISRYAKGDETVKSRIKQITDEIYEMHLPKTMRKNK